MQSTEKTKIEGNAVRDGLAEGNNSDSLHAPDPIKIDPKRIILIGAGGVGGFIAQHLGILSGLEVLCIVDGDSFERGNTSRQGFAAANLGQNKALAIAEAMPIGEAQVWGIDEFITPGNWDSILTHAYPDLLICAVDNDEARKLIFDKKDKYPILWGANELWSPQAGISFPQKPWSPLEAFESAESAGIACGMQTVHANACAASMAMQLLHLHSSPHEQTEKLPIFISKQSGERFFTMTLDDI